MSGRQTIAVDVDDVLAASSEALRLVVNERLGVNLSPEDYRIKGDYWQYYKEVWRQNGLADQISLDDLEPMMIENQSHVIPHQDAMRVLRHLAEEYRLIIVTSRPPSWRRATEQWVEQHFSAVFSEVLFTRQDDVLKHETKGELCRQHCADWLIDDNVEHAQSAVDEGLEVILFGDYGWQHKVPPHFHRCKDWAAVLEYFDERG